MLPWTLTYFEHFSEVLATNVIVGFDEDFPESTLTDGVIFSVEFIETMKSVAIGMDI